MVSALDQQRPEVDIASLGDAELRVIGPKCKQMAVETPFVYICAIV
jgi:hypothetical protein